MVEFLSALDDVVRAQPDATAIVARDATLSFGALAREADRLARRLSAAGVGAGDVVALSLGRSAAHVCAMLASWRTGAAFLPIDDAAPPERVAAILGEARARVRLSAPRDASGAIAIAPLAREGAPLGAAGDDLAYVVYTSGSTGRPKGVRVSHRALVPVLRQQIRAFGLGPGKRALSCLSTAFDASISDVGTALLSGATLVIADPIPSPAQLVAHLRASAITHADVPPSYLPRIDPEALPPTFETAVIGGEVCAPSAVRAWARRARVVNVYGPTEATICTSLCACDAERWSRASIGDPLEHVRYAIDDGELLIAGPALALGYVERPELEARRFVVRDGARWYRTGDRVRRDDDGAIVFVGRIDRQIKLRGQLVCPEEIEAQLRAIDGVADVTVTEERHASPGAAARASLTAWVAPREGARLASAALRDRLADALPRWMLPRIVITGAIARAATGKIDRAAYATRAAATIADRRTRALAEAFAEVLDVASVAEEDDFTALGGDSLAAVEVAAIAALAGVAVDPATILHARTPAAIARAPSERTRTIAELDAVARRLAREIDVAQQRDPEDDAWLVTGATGFLGRRLIAELLARTNARVHCVVRAATSAQARARVGEAAARDPRVVVHAGDLSAPHMGLAPSTWRALARSVAHVLHGAAALSLALPFEALEPSNVRGALEIARFVRAGGRKRLHHVSSLATLAATSLADDVLDERTTPGPHVEVHGAYAQTKWIAESLFREAAGDLTVIRPGLLTGDATTGESAASCPLRAFLRAVATLRRAPLADAERLRVDVTPVDYAARAIATIVTSSAPPAVVHVASERGASLADLVRALRDHGPIDDASPEAFLRAARDRLSRDAALALVASAYRLLGEGAHRGADLFLHTGRRFDVRVAEALTGERAPTIDHALLSRYAALACGAAS